MRNRCDSVTWTHVLTMNCKVAGGSCVDKQESSLSSSDEKKNSKSFDGFCYSLEELDLDKDSAYCVIPSGIMSQVEFFIQYR